MSDTEDRPKDIEHEAPPEPPTPAWWEPRPPPPPVPADDVEERPAEIEPESVSEPPPAPAWWTPQPPVRADDFEERPEAPEPEPVSEPPPAPAWWTPQPPVRGDDFEERPEAPEPEPVSEPPPAPAWWEPPPPVRADDTAEDHGWTPPPPPPQTGDSPAGPPAPPLLLPAPAPGPPARERPPVRHSRNPVDRLTRGLPNPLRVTIDWIVTIVGAVAIVLLVKAFVINPYRIPSSSMETTLHCAAPAAGCEARFSDRVLANRFLYRLRDPRRGEIIVFKTPPSAQVRCGAGGTFVKRLIGLPGETIEVRLKNGDGFVYINGKPLKERYLEPARRGAVQEYGPTRIKPGNYFMMGDNRSQSCDSRMWGTVPRANLIGKVFATYWPPNRISLH